MEVSGVAAAVPALCLCCCRLCPPAASLPGPPIPMEPPSGTAWERGTSRAAGCLSLSGCRDLCSKRVWVLLPEGFQQPSANCSLFLAVCSIKIGEAHAEESTMKNLLCVVEWADSHFLRFLASHPHSIHMYFPSLRQPNLTQIHPFCCSF